MFFLHRIGLFETITRLIVLPCSLRHSSAFLVGVGRCLYVTLRICKNPECEIELDRSSQNSLREDGRRILQNELGNAKLPCVVNDTLKSVCLFIIIRVTNWK
jgi:hypothetical protein